MNTTSKLFWTPLAILVLFFATVNTAWSEQVKFRFTGTGWDTAVDNDGDGYPITMTSAEAKGSLGASRVEITGEWAIFNNPGVECEDGYNYEFKLVSSSSIATFENQSQLFAYSNLGWMCVNTAPTSGHYYGQVFGIYFGGAGNFVGATGEWVTDFDGYFQEPQLPGVEIIGFRSISGNVKGHFELPE